jgi:death-on-curing protein
MPVWLEKNEIRYFHGELLREHGGLPGLKDEGALESTLARPLNLLAYEADATLFQLAASYGFGFARNHVFADGNKRVALVAINVFLLINGFTLTAPEPAAVTLIRELAAGELDEAGLSAWIKANSEPVR